MSARRAAPRLARDEGRVRTVTEDRNRRRTIGFQEAPRRDSTRAPVGLGLRVASVAASRSLTANANGFRRGRNNPFAQRKLVDTVRLQLASRGASCTRTRASQRSRATRRRPRGAGGVAAPPRLRRASRLSRALGEGRNRHETLRVCPPLASSRSTSSASSARSRAPWPISCSRSPTSIGRSSGASWATPRSSTTSTASSSSRRAPPRTGRPRPSSSRRSPRSRRRCARASCACPP